MKNTGRNKSGGLIVSPLRVQIGAARSVQHFAIDEPPQSWVKGEGGVPRCTSCNRDLHVEWAYPDHGVATCRCPSLERRSLQEVESPI
jgi:hypothetical protein